MGKKSDTFTTNISTHSHDVHVESFNLQTVCNKLAELHDVVIQQLPVRKYHVDKIMLELGLANKSSDNAKTLQTAIDNNGEVKKIDAILQGCSTKRSELTTKKSAAIMALGKALASLKKETADFNTYLTGKAASKNPFKTKNSLAAGQSTVSAAKLLITATEQLLGSAK
jgi:hypothetical protein